MNTTIATRRLLHLIRTPGRRLSLVGRYTLISVTIMLAAMLAMGVLYERFAGELIDRLTGERLNGQLTATANRLTSFVETRLYQLATLSNHPAVPNLVVDPQGPAADAATALLRLEADLPDLYGILFFDADGRLDRVVAGQAASGPPYWSARDWHVDDLPVVKLDGVEIIGPRLPRDGRSGWFLMRQDLRDAGADFEGSIALHVRLASLTELMSGAGVSGVIQPLLRAPGDVLLDSTGRPATIEGELIDGPSIVPGWSLVLEVKPGTILLPLEQTRDWLYLAAAVIVLLILAVFYALSRSLRRRVDRLLTAARSLAAGDLDYRVPEERKNDEISVVGHAFNTMAEQVQSLVKRTVRSEKMAVLGEFATGVAHEVRNPLATMKTTVQALIRHEADPERRQLLDDMRLEVDRLARVVDDLLTYGRPRPPSPRPVAVRDLFRHATSLLQPAADTRGVRVLANGDSRLRAVLDPDHGVQILSNLGLNAIQACENGGTVRLRAEADASGHVIVSVDDTGCGIQPEHVAEILNPFFTTKPRGTGLGLPICVQMVEANGGQFEINSTAGTGTSVRLVFAQAADDVIGETACAP